MKAADYNNRPDVSKAHTNADMDIGGPIVLWVGLVVFAGIFQIFLFPFFQNAVVTPLLSYINLFCTYILYIPGIFILPVAAALWMGHRAGLTDGTHTVITYRALINGIYMSAVYLVAIFMLYILSESLHTGILSTIPIALFVEYIIAIPVVVTLVVSPLFGLIASARRY